MSRGRAVGFVADLVLLAVILPCHVPDLGPIDNHSFACSSAVQASLLGELAVSVASFGTACFLCGLTMLLLCRAAREAHTILPCQPDMPDSHSSTNLEISGQFFVFSCSTLVLHCMQQGHEHLTIKYRVE